MKNFFTRIKKLFIDDRFLITVLLIYAIIVFVGEQISSIDLSFSVWLWADFVCTLIFLIEMIIKSQTDGFSKYFRSNWFDVVIIAISLPSLIIPFIPLEMISGLSVVLVLRLLRLSRVMRVLLLFHFLPNLNHLIKGFLLGIKQTATVLVGFFIFMFVFALVSCALFKDISPDFFGTPLCSLYSIFQLFTVEGWYEIPNAITSSLSDGWSPIVTMYFVFLVVIEGVIGMAFITSIFVDAMAEKDNDDMKKQLSNIEKKVDELIRNSKLNK